MPIPFTADTARNAARKRWDAVKAAQAAPPALQANGQAIGPQDAYTASIVPHLRDRCLTLVDLLAKAKDQQTWDRLSASLERIARVEAVYVQRPTQPRLRDVGAKQAARPGRLPVQAQPSMAQQGTVPTSAHAPCSATPAQPSGKPDPAWCDGDGI